MSHPSTNITRDGQRVWFTTQHIRCAFPWTTDGQLNARPGPLEVHVNDATHWQATQLVPHESLWLWAEYFQRRGFGGRHVPQWQRAECELRGDEIVYRYPRDPEWKIDLQIAFRVEGHCIDVRYALAFDLPHDDFELFTASYVASIFSETWIQATDVENDDGWVRSDNRRHPWQVCTTLRDAEAVGRAFDGRWDFLRNNERAHSTISAFFFKRPILVARAALTGAAVVFMGDPAQSSNLLTQYHERDTAHDIGFSGALSVGKSKIFRQRVALIPGTQSWDASRIASPTELWPKIDEQWERWRAEVR